MISCGWRTGLCALQAVIGLLPGPACRAADPLPATQASLAYHAGIGRSGNFTVPSLTWQAAKTLHLDTGFNATLEGPVYAQPLYWHPAGGAKPLLIVATEQNLVYALDAGTGREAWRKALGKPVPRAALPCGNIDPLGVTGTPVIDERTHALYLDAMVGTDSAASPQHLVFALSLKDGSVLPGWPVNVAEALRANGQDFVPKVQNQRGALGIVGNRVYVPYGGHYGDCGDFRGWVVAITLDAKPHASAWSTGARGGGIWAPGGLSSDGSSLFVATGNSIGARDWSGGESVLRLGLDLGFSRQPQDFFTPSDWRELDDRDLDLGSVNPALFLLPGATPSALVMALGKDGNAYLLDRGNLGGVGGALSVTRVASEPIRTAPAFFPAGNKTMLAFQGRGVDCPAGQRGDLVVLSIAAGAPPHTSVAWCAAANGRGAPMVTTTDGSRNPIVWILGAEGDNRLHGYRGDTGAVVFDGGGTTDAMSKIRRFQTLLAADGRLYVAADRQLYAFTY